jgi:hypothetical protein
LTIDRRNLARKNEEIIGKNEMTDKELRQVVQARPFVPVRLHLTNGATYDLTHPDGILLSKRMAAIAVGDAIALVSLIHINEI